MAVRAKAEITLYSVVDISKVTRYYILQSSTANAPSKPADGVVIGNNWSQTEPSYSSGSTNTLYFVDQTIFSNGTIKYSAVSKSSSYEAAKEAWNKANSKPDMSDIGDYVASRGENLVTNGTCLLGNNKNFSRFTYDGSDTYYAGGSFKLVSKNTMITNDEFIPVDTANKYLLSYYIKNDNADARYYDMLVMYDIDKQQIQSTNVMYIAGSTTKLAKELKNGDTVVYLEDASGFNKTTTQSYHHGLIFWNYQNSKGYTYGTETYSRNRWDTLWDDGNAIDTTNNTITLKTPWNHGTFPVGTPVSQCSDGGTYTYMNANYIASTDSWIQKKGSIYGVGRNNVSGKFREGTAFVKLGWFLPYQCKTQTTTWLSTITLTQNVGIIEMDSKFEVTKEQILAEVKGEYATREGLKEVKSAAEQTANRFNWLVQSGDSSTNFELTDRVASLVAENINLKGLVTVLGAVTAGSFNLGSGKFKVSKEGVLEAIDAIITGKITANDGTIGGWTINENGLKLVLDEDSETISSFSPQELLLSTYNKTQDNSLFTSITPTGIYAKGTRESRVSFNLNVDNGKIILGEMDINFMSDIATSELKLSSQGLYITDDNYEMRLQLNRSSVGNLVLGYGQYEEGTHNTNIYGGSGIKFALKSPDVAWYPYYKSGNAFNIKWYGAGYITSSGRDVHFSIPLSKPIVGSPSVTISNVDGLTIRQNGKYAYASANGVKTATYTANIDDGCNSIHVKATMPNATDATNNDACGIFASLKITLK